MNGFRHFFGDALPPLMKRFLVALPILVLLASCATAPKTYQPPNNSKLNASSKRLSKAVDSAHTSAKKANASVGEASRMAAHARSEVAKIKDVPPALVKEMDELDAKLGETLKTQADLETQLQEADNAKTQVEKDKADYYQQAQGLANDATTERNDRIKAEKSLHWYRIHWWGSWIIFGLGILACIVFWILKVTGKFTLLL